MKITELQAANLTIQLSALGQTDLSDNETDTLNTLEYLLSAALYNVRKAKEVKAMSQSTTLPAGPWSDDEMMTS